MTAPFPFPELIDSTQLRVFSSCQTKWMNEHGHHLSPLAINPHLHAGGAFSRGIEVVRHGFYKLNLTQEQSFLAGVRSMIEFWGDFEPPPKNPKTCEAMIGALENYLEEYPLAEDSYKPLQLDSGPAVEFTFSIPTHIMHPETGDPILFGGRFDMLAEFEGGQFIAVVDEKTTGSFGQKWTSQWGMRGQFIGYCVAATHYGYKTSTAVIRGIAILKTMYHQLQVVEEYSEWQMQRWWLETNLKISRMVAAWKDNAFDHDYGDACGAYGGCPFLPLCISKDPEQQFSNYQVRVWDPLKKDPTWPEGGPKYEVLGTLDELMEGM